MQISRFSCLRVLHQTACPLDKFRLGFRPDSEVARRLALSSERTPLIAKRSARHWAPFTRKGILPDLRCGSLMATTVISERSSACVTTADTGRVRLSGTTVIRVSV